jgi:hypothetical protein
MVIEAENDPSISANGYTPKSGKVPRQRVQMEAGQIHIIGVDRYVQLRQHTGDLRHMLRQ